MKQERVLRVPEILSPNKKNGDNLTDSNKISAERNCLTPLGTESIDEMTIRSSLDSKEPVNENEKLQSVVLVQLEILDTSHKRIMNQKQEPETLNRVARHTIPKRKHSKLDEESSGAVSPMGTAPEENSVCSPRTASHNNPCTVSSYNLATRYFGRRSKTVPSRALKRRYLGPPKNVIPKTIAKTLPAPETPTEQVHLSKEMKPFPEKVSLVEVKRVPKKRGKRPKELCRKTDFLTTDKAYFLSENKTAVNPLVCPETFIHVPSWKLKPVTSFYQMEGTENLNDPVFERRHSKCEQDERRRKRWDIQRLREQKVSEKLKLKYCREAEKESGNIRQQTSFYPDPRHIQYIEITEELPVLAFGHLIPLFQPSEFSLSWKCGEDTNKDTTDYLSSSKESRKNRVIGSKIT